MPTGGKQCRTFCRAGSAFSATLVNCARSLISRAFEKSLAEKTFLDKFLIKFHGKINFGYFVRGSSFPACVTCGTFAAGLKKGKKNETNRKSFRKKPILAEKSFGEGLLGRGREKERKSINQITQLPNGPQRQHPCRLNISFLSPRNASTRLESSLVDVMSIA